MKSPPSSSNSGRKSSDHSINSIISSPSTTPPKERPLNTPQYSPNEIIDLIESPVKNPNTSTANHTPPPKQKSVIKSTAQPDSESSSDCEVVGVFPSHSPVKQPVIQIIEQKNMAKEKPRLSAVNSNKHLTVNPLISNPPQPAKKKKYTDGSEEEIDVNRIMMDIIGLNVSI